MTDFNNQIARGDVQARIPETVSQELLENVRVKSIVLANARRLQNMPTNITRMPVNGAMAQAYFVQGDTGLKKTTKMTWANKYIQAEEIAAIVPIPEAVAEDNSYDTWSEVRPSIEDAIAILIDQSVIYGTGIPSSWTANMNGAAGLISGAEAAGHIVSAAAFPDLYQAILGQTDDGQAGLFGLIEEDGFMPTSILSPLGLQMRLRGIRTTEGAPIFLNSMQQAGNYTLNGVPMNFPLSGVIDPDYWMIAGQWNQLVWAMRKDITFTISNQAVIQDDSGNIVFNLFQQDMVALRAVVRLGFALPNLANRVNPNDATRYPFSVLTA